MRKALIIFFILNFCNPAFSSTKEKIISKLLLTNNLSFSFIQTVEDKDEKGNCIIKYPKKIYCEYEGINKKIIVSNGSSLVVKIRNSNNYYIYSLKKTPLEFLLDKNFLVSKISILKSRDVDNKYLNFRLFKDGNEINIFFNKKTFELIGWQTKDIYQNLVITFISSIKVNQNIDDSIFILPKK